MENRAKVGDYNHPGIGHDYLDDQSCPHFVTNVSPDITFPGIMVIHTKERRIEVMPGVEADEAARAVLRALEGYLPAPCKEDH